MKVLSNWLLLWVICCFQLATTSVDAGDGSETRPSLRDRVPAMVGDFFGGSNFRARGSASFDRLFVYADDLDAPATLPPGNSTLSISEPGPVGIFATSLMSVQQAQSLFRSGDPLPGVTLAGTISGNASLTTSDTISQIQSQLAATPQGYDIILLQTPSGTYAAAVDSVFQARNTVAGTTVYNSSASGAMIQGGGDTLNGGEDLDAYYFYDHVINIDTAIADAANGSVGSLKIAEGGSVLPQDRVFFRYSYIGDVAYGGGGLSRFTPGFEKSFLNQLFSFEVRLPFVADAATNVTADGRSLSTNSDAEVGNVMMYFKALLLKTNNYAISGGLGLALPSAESIEINLSNGSPLLRVANDSVQIQPFLGGLYMPGDKWFAQGFTQFSFATSDNAVYLNPDGNGLQQAGSISDPSYLFADLAVGCFAYRNDQADYLTAIIPTFELHQTSSLDDAGAVSAGNLQVGNFSGSTSITSAVLATTFEFGLHTNLTAAYAFPLSSNDRQYDGALRFQYTRSLR
ncbi:hypothetical protein NZK35_05580 [Stieleria sp. ICT_E10.1]|uniref:hypothetical protein n=1 Tax=Stieleria sedimenti TaxID=2976331 RepID=UPI002180270E|nr:hypothetical protein [Stieleria sedimenti]MCS7466144.1 hypothetical protein [Stieleria sedimenti]